MATPRRRTREEAEAEIVKLRDELGAEYRGRVAAEAREKETRAQFADLKERLANAEADTQRMRGYIARVQEDDVVREELITIGEPDGEQQKVPKRKPTSFHTPAPYSHSRNFEAGYACNTASDRDRRPRHWVTY
jgi:hypothetical protein